MKRTSRLTLTLGFLLIVAFAGVLIIQTQQRRAWATERSKPTPEKPRPHIVSLVPSVTETLFMLGLGDHIVARSDFCDFPEIVTNLPALGSLGHVNIEAIARLKPDFVILSDAQAQSKIHTALAKLKINHLGVPANSLNDIYQSVWDLSERFSAQENAKLWMEHMDALNQRVQASAPARKPRVLVCAGRDVSSINRLYISGKNNFYEDIVKLVGGENAYLGKLPFPMVSPEGVVQMNPDIIVDIVITDSTETVINALYQWSSLTSVDAIKTGNVHILTESWAARPGPRIDELIRTLAEYVAEWDTRQ